jgi:hypothetical protein
VNAEENLMKIHRGLLAVGLAGGLTAAACSSNAEQTDRNASPPTEAAAPATTSAATVDPVRVRRDMRALWEDHVAWTRLFIVSAVAGLPDLDATAQRLLQNQADIGDAVATYYGEEAGAALTALLRDHILIAGDLVTAAKSADQAKVTEASTAWYANADEIAAFLAAANPAWPEATLKDMMRGHLDQTLAEATAQLTGDYPQSVAEYDHIVTHILEMADTLTDGIVTQFPDALSA